MNTLQPRPLPGSHIPAAIRRHYTRTCPLECKQEMSGQAAHGREAPVTVSAGSTIVDHQTIALLYFFHHHIGAGVVDAGQPQQGFPQQSAVGRHIRHPGLE